MVIKKIPAGTRMYLTKKMPYELYIQPDKTLVNDNLYVAYDVKIDGEIVIPKGTRVVGDWVTESNPSIAAQLQLTKIYLHGSGQQFLADSDVIEAMSCYNNKEINNACYFYIQNRFRSRSNLTRRIAKVECKAKILHDDKYNICYLEIFTKEIPVTVTTDFIPFPCLD